MSLNKEQKRKLLEIARKTIERYVKDAQRYEPEVTDSALGEKRGVFVTLKSDGRLRGCIGCIMGEDKLYLSVRDMAIQSATGDPRFPPVDVEEIDGIQIEISALTPPKEVKSAEEIEIPGDGVIVKKGLRQGVYLPQVAEETGFSREEFLSSLCSSKAGLSPEAWKESGTKLFTFRAEVFSEKEFKKDE